MDATKIMMNAKPIIAELFVTAVTVGIFSWILGIVEFILSTLMNDFVFRKGMKVINIEERASFMTNNVIVDKIFETDSGKFKFIDAQSCIFRNKMPWLSFRLHTPFPLKGYLKIKNGLAFAPSN